MQGMGIIDSAANLSNGQVLLEGIALLRSNRVLMIDVFAAFRFERGHDSRDLLQQATVRRGVRPPRVLPFRKMAQVDTQNCCLDLIETAVPARFAAEILLALALAAQSSPV